MRRQKQKKSEQNIEHTDESDPVISKRHSSVSSCSKSLRHFLIEDKISKKTDWWTLQNDSANQKLNAQLLAAITGTGNVDTRDLTMNIKSNIQI